LQRRDFPYPNGLLKNAHLDYLGTDFKSVPLFPFAVQRTSKYASRLRISGALHLDIFEQPAKGLFQHAAKDKGRT